jgi:hypothetical protein
MANQTQPQQPTATLLPGLFGLPQGSLPLYGHDTTIDLPVTLGPTTQVQQQLKNVQNTDVIGNYRLNVNLNITEPTNSTTPSDVSASPLQPYSALQNITLSIQNVFNSLNTNGIDLAIKNILWPWSRGARYDFANLVDSAVWSTLAIENRPYGASGAVLPNANFYYDLGPSQYFDHYYEVDLATGRAISVNGVISQRIYAGVQYMGGTTRVIVPSLTFSPILGNNLNQAYYIGTATTNGSGTATLTLDREGWFSQTSPAKMPAITNWVPQFTTSFITIGAATEWVYEIPKSYQVLGLVFRFFDPVTNTAPSQVIPRATVQVGSGIQLFDGSGTSVIKRMYDQFDLQANLIPYGSYVFDFSHNHNGELTNAHAINTYVTNGCIVKFQLPSGGSDQFGCYVSVYGLQYVNQGSGL